MKVIQPIATFLLMVELVRCTNVRGRGLPDDRNLARKTKQKRQSKATAPTKSTKSPTPSPTAAGTECPEAPTAPETVPVEVNIFAPCADTVTTFTFLEFDAFSGLFSPVQTFSNFGPTPVEAAFSIPVSGCTKVTSSATAVISSEECSNAVAKVFVANAAILTLEFDTPNMFLGKQCFS